MKKYLPNISAFFIVFGLTLLIGGFLFPETASAQAGIGRVAGALWGKIGSFAIDVLLAPLGWVAILILQLTNLLLFLAGEILDMVIQFTVVEMRTHLEQAGTIDRAWGLIRDLANMGFIFILLYAAIQTILGIGSNTKKVIVNVIVVAILINFSLFATKLVIDASNVLALFFYDAISDGSGIADRMLDELELETLINTGEIGLLDGKKLIVVGLLGSVVVLIASFIFFATAIMFTIRFVILMLVLIFSPIAFMAYALPALEDLGKKWREALISQAFFAPIYLLLTWIVINVSDGLFQSGSPGFPQAFSGTPEVGGGGSLQAAPVVAGELGIIMNFMIIAALLVTSLIVAKNFANRAGSGVAKMNKWALGAAGGVAFGAAAFAGRQTIGRAAAGIADNKKLKDSATAGNRMSRLALWAGRKGGAAGFDVRGTALGGTLETGSPKTKKGYEGFAGYRRAHDEKMEKIAKTYGPTEVEIDEAEQAVKRAATEEERKAAQVKLDTIKGVGGKEAEKRRNDARKEKEQKLKQNAVDEKAWEEKIKKKEEEVSRVAIKDPANRAKVEQELEDLKKDFEWNKESAGRIAKMIEASYEEEIKNIKTIPSLAKKRAEAYASIVEKDYIPTILGYNKTAAARIRTGKSSKDKAAEALKDLQKEGIIEGATEEEKPEAPPETPPEDNQKAA